MSLRLLTYPALAKSQKILITAQLAGVQVEVDENVTPQQLAGMTLHGKAPVLQTPQGNLSESNAIARFIARKAGAGNTIYGKGEFEAALVDSWMDFCTNEIEIPATLWVAPILGWMENIPSVTQRAINDLKKGCKVLDDHLKTETFLVGRQITLADIAVATTLLIPMKIVMDEKVRGAFPNLTRWFVTCLNQQAFVDVCGVPELCEVALDAPAATTTTEKGEAAKPKGEAAKPKGEAAAKPKGGDAAKPKDEAAAKPKAEAPAKSAKRKPEERDAEEEEEEPAVQEEKKKNPLDDLPKSKFVLDAWKREYSNAPGGDCFKAMPYFWQNHDPEGYSLWFADHKYDDECTVTFKTSNLVGGFMQKSEEMRKYAFGVMQIVGTTSAQKIVGAWLIRGNSIQPLLNANEMADNFTWTKLADKPSDGEKKRLEELWCEGDKITVNGTALNILDCKVFK